MLFALTFFHMAYRLRAMNSPVSAFLGARAFLLEHREDYARAYRDFRWPILDRFNWALDYFDAIAVGNERPALWMVSDQGRDTQVSFAALSARSNQVANFLRRQGVRRGDRLIVMLPNVIAMWETVLAAMKLGAVVIPAASLLTASDLSDRFARGGARHVVTDSVETEKFSSLNGDYTRIAVGTAMPGWVSYTFADDESTQFEPEGPTQATDPLLLYFTSGTTALPKLVMHSHQSYPVGHLATMYWIGLKPGDLHLNISSPGWAKHAWSSLFAPWNAGATIFVHQYARFDARATLSQIERCGVTTLCAPPTVWRMFVLQDLPSYRMKLREIVSAGEPLNPEIIDKVGKAWGVTIRDGFGQTENVCLLGNFPGQRVKPGSVGKPSPGHDIVLLDSDGLPANDGEISLRTNPRPLSLFEGYVGDPLRTDQIMSEGLYRTGDLASRDSDGHYRYIGRADDVFKSSDYRVSPFELESVLMEHPAIAESAVVPSRDEQRWTVPKAFVVLKPDVEPTAQIAQDILAFVRERMGPHKRIRRIEFAPLPKTISGKIRRVELRGLEEGRGADADRRSYEYWEEDFVVVVTRTN
jgi:acetyl-CoA synthetase